MCVCVCVCVSLSLFSFFWCRVSPTVNFSFFFFSGVAFHRPLISLSFFFSEYIFKSFLVLRFFSLSIDEKNSYAFLIFFWRHFDLPIWAGRVKTVYSLHHRHVCLLRDLSVNWLFCFFPLCRFDLPTASYLVCFLANGIQASNRSLVARRCLPVHTTILGTLDGQSVSTYPLQTSRLLLLVCEGNKKGRRRERKRETETGSIFMSKIWIWLSPGSKFITISGEIMKSIENTMEN